MEKNIIFFLNGYKFLINQSLTLKDILNYFGYQNSLFIVEYNNLICAEIGWTKLHINSNDKIEIISIVGGG